MTVARLSNFCGIMSCVTAISLLPLATAAYATSSIVCSDINASVAAHLLFGAGPVDNLIDVTVNTNERKITTQDGQPGELAFIAQFFADDQRLSLELIDEQAIENLVSMRVLRYEDGEIGFFQIGYIRIGDASPIGVTCDGP